MASFFPDVWIPWLFQYPGRTPSTASGSEGNVRLLGALREDEVRDVLSYTQARRYSRGDLAIRQGDTDHGLYVIMAGCLEVVGPSVAASRRKALLQRGDIFGELAFFDHQPRSTDVRAIDDSEVVVMTATGFDRLRLHQPQLALQFVLHLGRVVSLRCRRHDLHSTALNEL